MFLEEKPRGTFGCLSLVKKWIGKEDFIVMNGDSLVDFDLSLLLSFHQKQGKTGTACLLQSNARGNYVVPILNSKGQISKLQRKIVDPETDFICSGIYVFKPEIFKYDEPGDKFLLMEADVLPRLAKGGGLVGSKPKPSRFFDCGTLESWEKAILEW